MTINAEMTPNEMIAPSWEDIEQAVHCLANYVRSRAFTPDIVVGIARGGLVPAVMLSHRLGVDRLGSIDAKRNLLERSYSPSATLSVGRAPKGTRARSVLLVDDIVGQGVTFSAARSALRGASAILAVSLFLNTERCKYPEEIDFFARSTKVWVLFPWEKHE